MNDLAIALLKRWIEENVTPVPAGKQVAEAERLAAACIRDAAEEDITEDELTAGRYKSKKCPLLMLWTAPPTGRASALESVADEATRIRRSSSCWQSRPLVSTSRSRSFRFMASTRRAASSSAVN